MGWRITSIVISVLVLGVSLVIIITIIVVSYHQISELDLLHQNFFYKYSLMIRSLSVELIYVNRDTHCYNEQFALFKE